MGEETRAVATITRVVMVVATTTTREVETGETTREAAAGVASRETTGTSRAASSSGVTSREAVIGTNRAASNSGATNREATALVSKQEAGEANREVALTSAPTTTVMTSLDPSAVDRTTTTDHPAHM